MSNAFGQLQNGEVVLAEGISVRYGCRLAALPAALSQRFVRLECDADTRVFVLEALRAPHGRTATALFGLLRRVLSDYDAYGLLGMYPMHLLSAAQFVALLPAPEHARRPRRLLDVGAGNGSLTALAAGGYDEVLVTEASAVMRRALGRRGYRVLRLDLAQQPLPPELCADSVLCLNVLDRCSHPRTLLQHLRGALAPGGRLLLSVPLPLRPHVQRGAHTCDPEEPLPAARKSWEAGVTALVEQALAPAGLVAETLSRAPYLCRGDARTPLYVLDAALLCCSAAAR